MRAGARWNRPEGKLSRCRQPKSRHNRDQSEVQRIHRCIPSWLCNTSLWILSCLSSQRDRPRQGGIYPFADPRCSPNFVVSQPKQRNGAGFSGDFVAQVTENRNGHTPPPSLLIQCAFARPVPFLIMPIMSRQSAQARTVTTNTPNLPTAQKR